MELPKNLRSRAEPPLLLWLSGGAAIGVLVVSVFLTLHNTRKLAYDAVWVSHTHDVIRGLGEVLALVKDAESGQRGYLLTQEPRYLEPYKGAIAATEAKVAELEQLTTDNPRQQANFPELRLRVDNRFQRLDEVLKAKTDPNLGTAQLVSLLDPGRQAMESLREHVRSMVGIEQALLKERAAQTERAKQIAYVTTVICGIAAIIAVLSFLSLMRRYLRQRTEAEFIIAEQAERLRTTLASIGDAVITTDLEGRVIGMNPVAESLTGWSTADARQKPLTDVFRIVNETTRKTVENPAMRALQEGVIVGLANHTILIAKDGREFPIDDSAAPIRCKEGELVGCVLVFRDITERKRSEEALRASEERFRLALSADRSLGWWDVNVTSGDAVLSESYFSTLGVSPEAGGHTTAKWMADRLHPADRDATLAALDKAKREGSLFTIEHRLVRTDNGETVWVAPWGHYRYDEANKPVRFVGVFFDITSRKNREDELRRLAAELSEADRRKDEFLSILAHELRNPLAPLRNGLQIMRLAGDGEPAHEDIRAMMERQLGQMVRLVDDLLDVSRINSGNLELRKERINLGDAIHIAIETSKPIFDAGKHRLSLELPAEEIPVQADLVRLSQVFANLLNNAAKYSNPGNPVKLTVNRDGNEVIVAVKDEGIGIPPEMLPHIFEMFTQVDRSLGKSRGGLGIGLSLVRRLVDLHGGSVHALSEGAGKGSEFRVCLPIYSDAPSALSSSKSGDGKPSAAPCRILVADDNVDAAKTMSLMLKIMGNEVRTANDGLEAVEVAREFRPELVLLDIGMPRMNGLEACQRIREEDWGREMTIVALTGWGQEEDKARSRKAGFDEHLVKPVEPPVLARLLERITSSSGSV